MRIRPEHIADQFADSDGYWIGLRPGWKWDGDPVGSVHCIHEDTKQKAFREGIVPCECEDCRKDKAAVKPRKRA